MVFGADKNLRMVGCGWVNMLVLNLFKSTLAVTVCAVCFSQTRVDLGRQGRNVEFRSAEFTRPAKTGTIPPAECVSGNLYVKSVGTGGMKLHVCADQNQWVEHAGALQIENDGVPLGAHDATNFLTGPGLLTSMTGAGSKISIQQSIDTAVV
jgi:hypothetical protein